MILSLVPYKIFPPKTGGQKAISLFTEHLAEEIPVVCVTVRSNSSLEPLNYKVLNIIPDSRLRYINPFLIFKLRKLIKQYGATHLLIEHPYFGWLGMILQRTLPVKLIVRSHNIEAIRWRSLHKWWWNILFHYEKMVHRRADYNLFITEEDKQYAIQKFSLSPKKCMTATFGTQLRAAPSFMEKKQAALVIRKKYDIPDDEHLFIFNGIFSYKPNTDALHLLLYKIHPLLIQAGLKFRLIICGKDVPAYIISNYPEGIVMAGFVDDLALHLAACDFFLNPITDGGGIKTKLVEALAYNLTCVSFESGANGIPPEITGSKLYGVPDKDIDAFCKGVFNAINSKDQIIPGSFFAYFNWTHIAKEVTRFIHQQT